MKVAIVLAADFQGIPYGGTVALVQDLLEQFSRRSLCDMVLVGLSIEGSTNGQVRRIGTGQYPFVSLATVRNHRSSVRKAMALGILRRSSWYEDHRPDVLYAHSPEIGAALAIRFPRLPMVLHCHGTDNPLEFSRFPFARTWPPKFLYERLVFWPALRSARRVLVNADTPRFRAFRRECGHSRVERVVPSIDRSMFGPEGKPRERARWGIPDTMNVAIFTGRLERPKGVDLVIRAFAAVRQSIHPMQLLIVGEGTFRPELEALARSQGISRDVQFLGRRSRAEIASLLRASDVFVSGSQREAISMALLEAIGSGLPAVVTDVGGARELVEDGRNGFVVSVNRPAMMAERMEEVFRNREAMGESSSTIAARYNGSRIADQVVSALSSAVGDRVQVRAQ